MEDKGIYNLKLTSDEILTIKIALVETITKYQKLKTETTNYECYDKAIHKSERMLDHLNIISRYMVTSDD